MSCVTGIRMCYAPATDIPAMREFYETVLGFDVKFVDGDNWVQFGFSGSSFAIAGPRETPENAFGPVVVFDVSDFEGLQARLEAAGRSSHVRDMGNHGRVLTILDPAGHPIQFFSRSTTPV